MRLFLAVLALAGAAAGASAQAPPAPCAAGIPAWSQAKRMTVVTDSVLYGAYPNLRRDLSGWRLRLRGYPSMTLPAATRLLRSRGSRLAPLVVVGMGYNSNWQRGRENYAFWARHFDRDAREFLRTLRRFGARQVIWVNLREATAANSPPDRRGHLQSHAWYFPYVNERLRRLARTEKTMVLANWARAADRPGFTSDTIHLNRRGARLMARTIESSVRSEARRQARRCA